MKSWTIKDQKRFFLGGKIHCENAIWKIQIFASNYHEPKCLRGLFLNICSTRRQNIWGLKGKSKICVVRFEVLCILSARPTNTKKVKLNINSNPNIFFLNHWIAKKMGAVEVFKLNSQLHRWHWDSSIVHWYWSNGKSVLNRQKGDFSSKMANIDSKYDSFIHFTIKFNSKNPSI